MNPFDGERQRRKRRNDSPPGSYKRRTLDPNRSRNSSVTSTQDVYSPLALSGLDLSLQAAGPGWNPSHFASPFFDHHTPTHSPQSHDTYAPVATSNQRKSCFDYYTPDAINHQGYNNQVYGVAHPSPYQLPSTSPYLNPGATVYGGYLTPSNGTYEGADGAGPSTLPSNDQLALPYRSWQQVGVHGNPEVQAPGEWCGSTQPWNNYSGPETAAEAWNSLSLGGDDSTTQVTQSAQSQPLSFLEPSNASGLRYVDRNEPLLIVSLQQTPTGPRVSLRLLHSHKSRVQGPEAEFTRCQEVEKKVDDLLSQKSDFLSRFAKRCRERAHHDHTAHSHTFRLDPNSVHMSAIAAKVDNRSLAMIASFISWVHPCRPVMDLELDRRMRSGEFQLPARYTPPSGFVDATEGDLKSLTKLSPGEIPNPELAPWAFGKYMI
jgi:hypothetical protein